MLNLNKYFMEHKDEIDAIDIRAEVRQMSADSIALHEIVSDLQSMKNDGRKATDIDDILDLIDSFIDINKMKLETESD